MTSRIVSVIIPFHNRFDVVRRSVASLWAQTYRPIEVILVDDVSDDVFELDTSTAPEGITTRIVRMTENGGPGAARELGRGVASGSYIAYLDSDDYWGPGYLETMVEALRGKPQAGMAYCTALDVEDGTITGICKRSNEAYSTILPTILYGRPWHTSSCLWRREVTDKIGAWLPLWNWEDYEYDCRAGCLGIHLVHVQEPLCYVQRDAEDRISVSSPKLRTVVSMTLALQSMAANIKQTSWASIPSVRLRISQLALSNAKSAIRLGNRRLTISNICQGWIWMDPLHVRLLFGLPLLVTGSILGQQGVWSIRLINWLQRRHQT